MGIDKPTSEDATSTPEDARPMPPDTDFRIVSAINAGGEIVRVEVAEVEGGFIARPEHMSVTGEGTTPEEAIENLVEIARKQMEAENLDLDMAQCGGIHPYIAKKARNILLYFVETGDDPVPLMLDLVALASGREDMDSNSNPGVSLPDIKKKHCPEFSTEDFETLLKLLSIDSERLRNAISKARFDFRTATSAEDRSQKTGE